MNSDMSEIARRQERFRVMMIGLALGDARLGPDGETLIAARPPIWRCVSCMR